VTSIEPRGGDLRMYGATAPELKKTWHPSEFELVKSFRKTTVRWHGTHVALCLYPAEETAQISSGPATRTGGFTFRLDRDT